MPSRASARCNLLSLHPRTIFFFLCKRKKVLIVAWQFCILEQAPVDQVSLEKSRMCACISCLHPNRSLGSGNQHPANYSPVRMLPEQSRAQPSRQKARSHAPGPAFSQSRSTARGIKHWQGPHFVISGNHPGRSTPACSPLLMLSWPDCQQYYTTGLLPTPWRPHTDAQSDPACPHMQTSSNGQSDMFLERYPYSLNTAQAPQTGATIF